TSPAVTVNVGAFTKLQILAPGENASPGSVSGKTGTPLAQTAGTAFTVTVNAVDANWNLVSTNHTVHLASSDTNGAVQSDTALAGGTQTMSVTFNTAGSATVTASDASSGAIAPNTTPAISVGAGTFAKLQILAPGESAAPGTILGKTGSPTGQTAGTAFN